MTSAAPLIGILGYRLAPGRVSLWPWGGFAIPEGYVQAVLRAGGVPAILPPTALENTTAAELATRFDGIILAGGGDMDPHRYGDEPGDSLYGMDAIRDGFELEVVRAAAAADVPTLAICRGFQVTNVAFG